MGNKKKKSEIEQAIRKENKRILSENVMLELKLKEKDNKLNEEEAKSLVQANYLTNCLVEIKDAKEKILVMGINPGGGKEIKEEIIPLSKRIQCLDSDIIEEDVMNKLTKALDKNYIYQKYYYQNYKLFKDIEGRLFWSYYSEEELISNLLKMLNDVKSKEMLQSKFKECINKEREKIGPCILFGDLFWYADGKQENIKKAINIFLNKEKKLRKEENEEKLQKKKNELNEIIKNIMDKQIEFYKPIMIVVTNAYASDLIKHALEQHSTNDLEDMLYYKNTYIIFSGMVSGQRIMDKYSYFRLKSRINSIYEDIKKLKK